MAVVNKYKLDAEPPRFFFLGGGRETVIRQRVACGLGLPLPGPSDSALGGKHEEEEKDDAGGRVRRRGSSLFESPAWNRT